MIKPVLTILFLFIISNCFSQVNDTLKKQGNSKAEIASFVTKLDIVNATKDGIYLNGYVVNISYEKAKKLNGKKIKVTGRVTIIKGIKNLPNNEIQQGREEDAKHILSPKIKIIKV